MRDERRKFFSWVLERRTNVWILKKREKGEQMFGFRQKANKSGGIKA